MPEEIVQQYLEKPSENPTFDEMRSFVNSSLTNLSSPMRVQSAGIQSANYVEEGDGWKLTATTAYLPNITLSGGTIKYLKTSFTDTTHTGYYIGAEGFYFGSSNDATKLKFTIADGTTNLVGGGISNSAMTGAMTLNIGSGNNVLRFNSTDGLWAGHATFASATFSATLAGALKSTSGEIAGWTISSTTLANGTNIILDSSNKAISINSSTYGNAGIQLQYNAGTPRVYFGDGANAFFKYDGTKIQWKGTNSELDASGNFICTGGTMGGWNINSTSIYTGTEDHSGYTTNSGDMTIYSDGTDSSIHAKEFYIDALGILNCNAAIIGGSTISTPTITGIQAGSEIAIQGWQSTLSFTSDDADTVSWSAGNDEVITLLDGTTYTFTAGNTGNMTALTYIYLDINVSTTVLQTTTTAATAVGSGKILIGVAENNSDASSKATFKIFGGSGGESIIVDNLVANSASTNEFIANTAQIKDAIINNAKITDLNVDKLVTGTMTSQSITLGVTIGGADAKIQAGKSAFGDTARGFILGIDDIHDTLGDATSQWDVTNPVGTTFRYTWDGTGLDPDVDGNTEVDDVMQIAGFNAGNNGNFTVTAVGTTYFEVTNASGVVEVNITSATLEVGGRVKFEMDDGTITGGIIQTGRSGERIKLNGFYITIYDTNDITRATSNNGNWYFYDPSEVWSGAIFGSSIADSASIYIQSTNGAVYLTPKDYAYLSGDFLPTADGAYDLGCRPDKWDRAYLQRGLRLDYATAATISVIDDADSVYTRIRFDASGGNIGFGRTIYPITNDTYSLGVSSTGRWNNMYMVGNVNFETTVSKGLIWDAAGDNAQFYYSNTSNYFVINKQFNANSNKIINLTTPTNAGDAANKSYVDGAAGGANTSLSNLSSVAVNTTFTPAGSGSWSLGSSTNKWNNIYMTGSIVVGGSVDGVDISDFASSYNTHVASVNSHHNKYSSGYAITPASVATQYLKNTGNSTRLELHTSYVKTYDDFLSSSTSYNIGSSVSYFNELNYKTLQDRGCLGWFDEGVELRDGRIVSDMEALQAIKKHPTKKTIYGVDMMDYKTFPKVAYTQADEKIKDKNGKFIEKKMLPRDKNDQPYKMIKNEETGKMEKVEAQDGIEMTSMFSIMIGALKELDNRLTKIESKI